MRDVRLRGRPVGAGLLRFLVQTESAGKLIGRRGARIHEVQVRTGTRVQLIDRGEEKLVEVMGSRASIDEAIALMMGDLVHAQRPNTDGQLSIAVLIPEALVGWISGTDGKMPALTIDDLSVSLLGSWDSYSERRVLLRGGFGPVCQSLQVLNLRLRRHARWVSTGMHDLPWELCDLHDEGDPADGFFSTENFRLGLQDSTSKLLSGNGVHGALLAQIQEDSGSAIRVQTDTDSTGQSWIEIAGSFSAKLRALLEVASLLLLLTESADNSADASGVLDFLLPAVGPSSLTCEEVRHLPVVAASLHSIDRQNDRIVLRLRGRRTTCCTAVLAIGRETEKRAAEYERLHGPPPLLIDYLARWFGRDVHHWPQSFLTPGAAEDKKRRRSALPVTQIASCGHTRDAANFAAEAVAAATAVATAAAVAMVGADAASPESLGASLPGLELKSQPAKVGTKRRRRIRLSNPFSQKEPQITTAGHAGSGGPGPMVGAENLPARPATSAMQVTDAGSGAHAGSAAAGLNRVPGEVCFLAGYSDGDSDSEAGRKARDELAKAQDYGQSDVSDDGSCRKCSEGHPVNAPEQASSRQRDDGHDADAEWPSPRADAVSGLSAEVSNAGSEAEGPDALSMLENHQLIQFASEAPLPSEHLQRQLLVQPVDSPRSREDLLRERRQELLRKLELL